MDHVVENSLLRCDDTNRRRWLIATSILGGAGGIATVVPFVDSFAPSEKARAAGASVSVDLSQIAPGTMTTVAWRGMPVFVVNRTERMLKEVVAANEMVLDPFSTHPFTMPLPTYCTNQYRSRVAHPNFLVVMGVCTHLGCTPSQRFQSGPQPNLPNDWPGGFLCPCHGSTYDLAGRVFKNKPAPQNLDVPRFQFDSPEQLSIGKDEHGEA
ncbi:ubiquinol-cytochrome c reductase iron-sulfur subunit [Caballeronia sp. DA-9]|uniref:ubiquinol-cytochrome c reductase iron-sulfur subunit n=1 Tax=Caballeronia sp. DA-9 TaxID=3436237 RepID=UPI003F66A42D